MLKLVSLLFLASLACADKVVNINKQIDEGLVKANEYLTKFGFGLHRLPDHKFGDIELRNGAHVGLNSLQRSADATSTIHDDGSVVIDLHLGWHLFASAYGRIKSQGLEYSGGLIVKDSSFRISYQVVSKPKCDVTLNNLEFERLGKVSFVGSNPAVDGDISDVFAKHVVPYYNGRLDKAKSRVEDVLRKAICIRPDDSASEDLIPAIFKAIRSSFNTQ
uniref:Uncharacterized protein n=1 Tax=Riptortus pedestris TaxID=329032 RepID=R4WQG2_RIPPE|nr:unknown secreted protein [Riptortus pedestris]